MVLVRLAAGMSRRVDHFGFESLMSDRAFGSAPTQMVDHHSVEIDWTSRNGVYHWF